LKPAPTARPIISDYHSCDYVSDVLNDVQHHHESENVDSTPAVTKMAASLYIKRLSRLEDVHPFVNIDDDRVPSGLAGKKPRFWKKFLGFWGFLRVFKAF